MARRICTGQERIPDVIFYSCNYGIFIYGQIGNYDFYCCVVGFHCGLCASANHIQPAAPATTAAFNLSGQWSSTELALITLVQKGDKITGTYQYGALEKQVGEIDAVLQGDMLKGVWREWTGKKKGAPETNGEVEWKVLDNGRVLMGKWRNAGEKEWEGDWNFIKK